MYNLIPCRECGHPVSRNAFSCPQCGAPYPSRQEWSGWGYEYKSSITILGLPLLHISFKYRPDKRPVVAKGIIAIGQFGMGIVNISQIGVGFISVGQISTGGFVLAQFGFAWRLIAQIRAYIDSGYGQLVWNALELARRILGG